MKILSPYGYFVPEQTASAYMQIALHEKFAREEIGCVILTPQPTRGVNTKIRQYYALHRKEILYNGMLKIHRFPLYAEGKNPYIRALRYFTSSIIQLYYGIVSSDAKSCDAIFAVSTPPIQGAMVALIKKIRKKPIVYNLQDIFPDSLVGADMANSGGFMWKIGRIIEDFTYRNADRIIVISDDFKKNIMAKGVPEEKIVVVYNWVDENAVVPVAKENNPLYDELGISREKFSVVYAGNFGHAQNIDVTIAAAERLKDVEDIQFLMFGTGGLVEDYKKIAQEKGLKNMFFFPLQPVEKVSQVYSLGDLGIVACKKGLGKGAFPSKTWSIMSAGTPVIANYDEDTDLERLVKDNGLGVFSAADDSEQMAQRIMEMYDNRELCAEYGRNARQYILDNVSKDKSTQKYVDVIKEVVEEGRIKTTAKQKK